MASSFFAPPQKKNEASRNWAELPSELMASIMLRLGPFDVLENAQKVCRSWRRVSKDPSLWRKIDLRALANGGICDNKLLSMYRDAVDRSDGGLVEINIGSYCCDVLLNYIADRSSNLRSLRFEIIISETHTILVNTVAKLPLLEELEVSCPYTRLGLKAIGHSCPKLKSLKVNFSYYNRFSFNSEDDDALEIAGSMPELRHLQVIGNRLTETGLNAILDNCPHLEHLDLRMCLNINLVGDLEKRCLQRIKVLRRPNDSTDDCPFYVKFADSYSDDSDDDDDYYFSFHNSCY